jgi:hypothetical protein
MSNSLARPEQERLPAALVDQLRGLITTARQQALRTVDTLHVRTCREIERLIVEFEQQSAQRADYGVRLISGLSTTFTAEFGRCFDDRNLRNIRAFFQGVSIWNAVRTELSWTHYRKLLCVENKQARHWYMTESASQNLPSADELRAELEMEQKWLAEQEKERL